MPIVDVELVCTDPDALAQIGADALADALGAALASPPGHTWLRLRTLDHTRYAENSEQVSLAELPVFVTILHAHPPAGAALDAEVRAVTHAVAHAVARAPESVHVLYAPAGAGRQAFGGTLVR